jgi:hypothetical protein
MIQTVLTDADKPDRNIRVVDPALNTKALGYHGLALGWLKRGKVKQAIISLNRALETDPKYIDAYLDLARILLHMERWRELDRVCQRGLQYFVEVPELHKMMITAREEHGSIEDAFDCFQLKRRDNRELTVTPTEILCCVAVRNERPRLPWFVDYYRKLGVNRFFFIDNDSSDGTFEWLMEQPDVHVWHSALSFKLSNFGSSWFELLLRRYGQGHWCLTVDIDEFLIYEGSPERTLQAFCQDLEKRGKQVATGVLLDLYGDRPVSETIYRENDDPLVHCPFFDRNFCHSRTEKQGMYQNQTIFFGGVRQRVFPAEHSYLLSKAVLMRYERDVVLTSGQHLTNIAEPLMAKEEICLLHFKFFASVVDYAKIEAEREIHAMAGEQYKAYHDGLERDRSLSLYDPAESVRFEGTDQLQKLDIMSTEEPVQRPRFPVVPPPPEVDGKRPFWSVMITVYDRTENIQRVLESVLVQAQDNMQIEVVCDRFDEQKQQEIVAEVERIGKGRVGITVLPERLGHPYIFNRCIELAAGEWVHILHDDDWVERGFYSGLQKGIESDPEAGAAFCQHQILTREAGSVKSWFSWVERETPGIIDDWLNRIAIHCRVQFSAMAVRRDVYQAVGGFCPEALSAFDWEMWIRIAVDHAVFFLPELKVTVGRDGTAESSRLLVSGEQILHAFAATEVAMEYLPNDGNDRLAQKVRDHIASRGLVRAREFLESGNFQAALNSLQAAAYGKPSPRTLRRMTEFLRGVNHDFRG